MRRFFLLIPVCFLALMQAPAQNSSSRPPKGTSSTRPSLEGRILWKGPGFSPREVFWPYGVRGNDLVLERMLVGRTVRETSLLVDEKTGGIENCLVLLDNVELGFRKPAIVPVSIKDLQFSFRVVVLRPGGIMRLHNEDPLPHVLDIREGGSLVRSLEVVAGSILDVDLPKSESVTLVSRRFPFLQCNIFRPQWKPALVTGKGGAFAVRGLKAGKVELRVIHETLGVITRQVTIPKVGGVKLELSQEDFVPWGKRLHFKSIEGKGARALVVNGHVVGEDTFDDVLQFLRLRYDDYALPRNTLVRYGIEGVFIPLLASLDFHQNDVTRVMGAAQKIRGALAEGRSLTGAAREAQGLYFPAGESWIGRRDLDPWLGSHVFRTPRHLVQGPIPGARGLHFFEVLEVKGRGAAEKRRLRRVFLPWQPGLDSVIMEWRIRELARRARVFSPKAAMMTLIPRHNRT